MTMVEIGIPGGLSIFPKELKSHQEKGKFDFYEMNGNRLYLYFRSFPKSTKKKLGFDLKAEIPGKYTGTASSSYLYYTPEHKSWQPGLSIEISE